MFVCVREREKKSERRRVVGGQMKRGAVTGFQVPSGVVVFDAVIDKVISRGVKTLLLFNVHNDSSGFSKPKIRVRMCLNKFQ